MRALHDASQDLTGHVLGQQFRLERLLGRGGMGDVYLAEQLEVSRPVVIKLLRAAQLSDSLAEERFKREARALAQLNHPNIVHLYTVGRSDDGQAYLAMEYIAGRTLASLVAEAGALPEEQVVSILDQICGALVEAHGLGIIHRDLKPENVMLVERRDQPPLVKVLDFGIAKLSKAVDPKLTLDGEILGTPLYMAPEQLREHRADERSDIYALASIGYELLTGSVPFEAETTLSLIVRVMTEEVVPPRRRLPGLEVSAATDGLLTRCLAKDPRERVQSARELRDVLTGIARELISVQPRRADSGALSLPVVIPAATGGSRPRPRLRIASLLLLALLGAAGAWGYLALRAADVQVAVDPSQPGGLPVREWIQGLPFPRGADYVRFEPTYIEARIPASVSRVLAFYRFHLAAKWGGARVLPDGLAFDDPLAPLVKLRLRAARSGSQLTLLRRPPDPR
jgi:serine/threonine protein kinase